jgi:hypothetical protein
MLRNLGTYTIGNRTLDIMVDEYTPIFYIPDIAGQELIPSLIDDTCIYFRIRDRSGFIYEYPINTRLVLLGKIDGIPKDEVTVYGEEVYTNFQLTDYHIKLLIKRRGFYSLQISDKKKNEWKTVVDRIYIEGPAILDYQMGVGSAWHKAWRGETSKIFFSIYNSNEDIDSISIESSGFNVASVKPPSPPVGWFPPTNHNPVMSFVSELPSNPFSDDRYILDTDQNIYEYDGDAWIPSVPSGGDAVLNKGDGMVYAMIGAAWDTRGLWYNPDSYGSGGFGYTNDGKHTLWVDIYSDNSTVRGLHKITFKTQNHEFESWFYNDIHIPPCEKGYISGSIIGDRSVDTGVPTLYRLPVSGKIDSVSWSADGGTILYSKFGVNVTVDWTTPGIGSLTALATDNCGNTYSSVCNVVIS